MNTFSNQKANEDGWLNLSINDDYRSFENMIWSHDEKQKVSGVLFQSFFGGNDNSWASRGENEIFIRDARVGDGLTTCNF
jgi:hypothetical protein